MEEIWKRMGYTGCEYAVSNLGNVKHLAHDVVIKGKRNRKRYIRHYDEYILGTRMVERYDYGIPTGKFFKEARIDGGCEVSVAEEVLHAFTNKKVLYNSKIIYKDGNPENCCLDNLDYDEKNNI